MLRACNINSRCHRFTISAAGLWLSPCAANAATFPNSHLSTPIYIASVVSSARISSCDSYGTGQQKALLSTSASYARRYRPNFHRQRDLSSVQVPDGRSLNHVERTDGHHNAVQTNPHEIQRRLRLPISKSDLPTGTTQCSTAAYTTTSSNPSSTWNLSKADQSRRRRASRHLMSVGALEEELQWQARNEPHPAPIRRILAQLVRKHGMVPSQRHYEALLLSNCSPEGSAEQVRKIWKEMESNQIDLSASLLSAALSALAIHPMLSLQNEILAAYDERWLNATVATQHSYIISLIRTDQMELANSLLNDLHSSQKSLSVVERTPVPLHLYVLFLQHLVIRKDYEAVIRFVYRLRERNAVDMDLPTKFWSWILQHAAEDGDGWVCGWIWQDWVEKMRFKPSRQTCKAVLKIAARDKVSWLAESVRDTIVHGGVSINNATHDRELSSPRTLSDEESELIQASCGADLNTAKGGHGLTSKFRDKTSDIPPKNMWPAFDHTDERDRGRIDPWDALGPKSRRR